MTLVWIGKRGFLEGSARKKQDIASRQIQEYFG